MSEDTVVIELTTDQQAIVNAVIAGIENKMKHDCYFDITDRKKMHDFNDAVTAEKADHGTFLILIQTAKGIQNFTRKAILWFIAAVVLIVLSVFGGALIIK